MPGKPLTKFLDALPHDARAFECFDNSLEAYRCTPPKQHRNSNYFYHRYHNQRNKLILALRREGASESTIYEWLDSLQQQINLPL